jgi:hypothetical protein
VRPTLKINLLGTSPCDTNNDLHKEVGKEVEVADAEHGLDDNEEDEGLTTNNEVDEEAAEYLETLVRSHFVTVLEGLGTLWPLVVHKRESVISVAVRLQWTVSNRDSLIQAMITRLEEDIEITLAYFMKAVVEVRKTGSRCAVRSI